MIQNETISAKFPYKSRYLDLGGTKMHYVEEGEGENVILFLHGVPTSSYLWRNIIPFLSGEGRCVAPDLVGFGRSDKPDINYTLFDHINYLSDFIDGLGLKKITFVLHGWGSVIGFYYAMMNEDRVQGLAFLESYVRPTTSWDMLSLPIQEMLCILDGGDRLGEFSNTTNFVDNVLPAGVMRQLSSEEMACYREPFKEPGSAKPIWQYLRDLPKGRGDTEIVDLIGQYSNWLTASKCPKLMFYAIPGFNTTIDTVMWSRDNLPNLKLVEINDAFHYAQETHPREIGEELSRWYQGVASF